VHQAEGDALGEWRRGHYIKVTTTDKALRRAVVIF